MCIRDRHSARLVHPDGSGGPSWAPKVAPRAGAGAAVLTFGEEHPSGSITFASVDVLGAGVPERQTVPRAELTAILETLKFAPAETCIRFCPDATYTCKALNKPVEER
eukprot:2435168-Karenia_brevis.AAC.1